MAVTRRTHVGQKHGSHHKNVSKLVKGKRKMKVTARARTVGQRTKHRNTKSFMHP